MFIPSRGAGSMTTHLEMTRIEVRILNDWELLASEELPVIVVTAERVFNSDLSPLIDVDWPSLTDRVNMSVGTKILVLRL
jgi:hypothetical protein